MPEAGFGDVPSEQLDAASAGAFVAACQEDADHLVYFLLNVGDGDSQLILLPAEEDGSRRAIVVDIATTGKLLGLLDALMAESLLTALADSRTFPIVVATHPHADHIRGMPEFLDRHGHQVGEMWDPGYYHPSDVFVETMVALERHSAIQRTQPTSGMVRYLGPVKLTVLGPGIGLRSRFDSYGVTINDASITLRVEYPATRVAEVPSSDGHRDRLYLRPDQPWALLLGADTQTTGWAQTTLDFPEVVRSWNPALQRELRLGMGGDPLRAQVFKVPHHASKRGLNLELVERIDPLRVLVSCSADGRYGFPHELAVESLREALAPVATTGHDRPPDHELGIHCTAGRLTGEGAERPLGTVAVMVPPRRGASLRLWRFGDAPDDAIDFDHAREVRD